MGTTRQPKTGFPASVNPSLKEELTKKDTKEKLRKLRLEQTLCQTCGGTGRTIINNYGIAYCRTCGGDGIG